MCTPSFVPEFDRVNLPERIELPQLESLTFYEKAGFAIFLHLPSLRHLSFGSKYLPNLPWFDLPGTLSALHSLTTLTLDLFACTPELIIKSLSCASSLKCLTFKALNSTERNTPHLNENKTMTRVIEALTPAESDDLLVTTFCPNLETFECEMWPCFSDEALETMIIRRTSPKFQGSILRRVAVDFSQYRGQRMTLDLRNSLDNVVDEFFELKLKYFADEPDKKLSAWSGVGTVEMVPEWALESI